MKKLFFLPAILATSFVLAGGSNCCCPATSVSCPSYPCGFHAGGAWVYFQPTPTDADLEYGSFITLTTPPNLNALLLEVEPDYQSGYRLNLGYRYCNQSLDVNYLSFHAKDKDSKSLNALDEIIQNFLGGSYSTSEGQSKQDIDHVGLEYSLEYLFDRCITLKPYIGVGFADIERTLNVTYTDLVLNPTPSELTGREKSEFWGVGPYAGTRFDIPLLWNFSIAGKVGAGVLFGKVKSKVDSESFRDDTFNEFSDRQSDNRAITILTGDLSLQYTLPFCSSWGFTIQGGYAVDYYFKPIDRINPSDGYVNNPNPFPVRQSSNIGLGGPYVLVTLDQSICPTFCNVLCQWPVCDSCSGPYFNFTSSWLEPTPTNKDLVFATVTDASGDQKNQQVDPDMKWAGSYELGYSFCNTYDIGFRYFQLDQTDRTKVTTTSGGTISSVNASGPAFVTFSSAASKVNYRLDQFDGFFGKNFQLGNCFIFHNSVGLRYLQMDRKLSNAYFGGSPPLVTETKSPNLKSRFRGIGPIYSFEPDWHLFWGLSITGKASLAFLIGDLKATLDQINNGLLGESSNDFRTPKSPYIVPVFDGQIGLKYNGGCGCFNFDFEGGYQYSGYYRGVRLVLPVFLTGLNQINSNLILPGPYFRVGIGASF